MSEGPEKLVVSIDISDEMTYISYASLSGRGVITLASKHDPQKYGIPTYMFRSEETMKWSFGANALARSRESGGELYDSLLSDVIGPGAEEDTDARKRLGTFLAHSLELAAEAIDKEYMNPFLSSLSICLKKIDPRIEELMEQCTLPLKSVVRDIRFLTRAECFYYYTLSQPPEIWRSSVLLVDYSKEDCSFSHLKIKKGSMYSIATINEEHHSEMLPFDGKDPEKMDEMLCTLLKEKLDPDAGDNRITVSSVYLSGLNLEGNWAKNSLNYLCNGRRVFQGQNLYTKGACYAARDQLTHGFISTNFFFLSSEKVNYDIGIRMIHNRAEVVALLSEAGISWYDLKCEEDFILGDTRDVTLVLKSFPEGDEVNHLIRLDSFPERPKRACRINIRLYMKEPDVLTAEVTDRGLGELIPASGTMVTENIRLSNGL